MSGLVIACPNCGTRYSMDPLKLGDTGRSVRCARCGETWFANAPDAVDTLVGDRTASAMALDDLRADEGLEQTLLPTSAPTAERIDTPVIPPSAPTVRVGADVMMRDRADQAKLAARRRTLAIIWIVPLILVLVCAVLAVANRQAIVNRYPQTATLYQAVGLTVRLGGLEIDPPVATAALIDGTPVVRVEGAVRNLTGKTRPVPLIELSLDDASGASLAQWYVEPTQPTLPGRGQLTFQTEYADPPTGATEVSYRFVDDAT